jgi:hypothetical protein
MLTAVNPKLPMRNKAVTRNYYVNQLGFTDIGAADYAEYLIVQKDAVELHFFLFEALNPAENYGQVYIRTNAIEELFENLVANYVSIHPAGSLQVKPWGQKEFSVLDPDSNLLTFGEKV